MVLHAAPGYLWQKRLFEEGNMAKKFVNPPGMKPLGMYTQVTVAQGGSIAFISGQATNY